MPSLQHKWNNSTKEIALGDNKKSATFNTFSRGMDFLVNKTRAMEKIKPGSHCDHSCSDMLKFCQNPVTSDQAECDLDGRTRRSRGCSWPLFKGAPVLPCSRTSRGHFHFFW